MLYWFYLIQTRSLVPSFTQSEYQSSEKLFSCYLNVGQKKDAAMVRLQARWSTLAPHVRESGFRSAENFSLWNPESRAWNPKYSSRNLELHKRFESGIQVPLTKNPESRTWNPESKSDCFGFPLMGRTLNYTFYCNLKMISNHIRDRIGLKATYMYYKRHGFTTKFGVDKIRFDTNLMVRFSALFCFQLP